MQQPADIRVPVLVVSGFLGSGKTTLVRHLLRDAQASGARVAVISNEFGALGIDQALLGEGGEAKLRRLPDGSFDLLTSAKRGGASSGYGTSLNSLSDGARLGLLDA